MGVVQVEVRSAYPILSIEGADPSVFPLEVRFRVEVDYESGLAPQRGQNWALERIFSYVIAVTVRSLVKTLMRFHSFRSKLL